MGVFCLLACPESQLQKTRAEADEYSIRMQQAERESRVLRDELDQELEQARKQMLTRLNELEPLPEALRRTEIQLQEAQERERSHDKRNIELSTALTELRFKVCTRERKDTSTVLILLPSFYFYINL